MHFLVVDNNQRFQADRERFRTSPRQRFGQGSNDQASSTAQTGHHTQVLPTGQIISQLCTYGYNPVSNEIHVLR